MSRAAERLRAMEHEVRRFHPPADDRDTNHRHYVAELSQYLRTATDPLDLLRFVERLLASPFARRPQQKQALADVGEWLFRRLLQEPHLERDALAWELGWLQRMVMIRGARAPHGPTPPTSFRGRAPEPQLPDFRKHIESIEKRRSEAQVAARVAERAVVAAPPPPQELPAQFEAMFTDIAAVRDARAKAIERKKKGKEPKEAWLKVLPVDASLHALAGDLVCSLTTPGMDAWFDATAKNSGVPVRLWVAEVKVDAGRKIVGVVKLAAT